MIVYQAEKRQFLDHSFKHDIEAVILGAFKERTGRAAPASEIRSWKESLLAMAKVLNDDSIPADCGVAIEYGIPQTSKRIDFIVSGKGAQDRNQLLIVELKQWESARRTEIPGVVTTRFARGEANVSHPSYQAWSYAELLRNFNEAVEQDDITLDSCVYLHNCVEGGDLADPFYDDCTRLAPMFLTGEQERERLRRFIARHVPKGDRGAAIYSIERGRIRPSKQLVDALRRMMDGKREFVLVDDQKVVYETALRAANLAAASGRKQVLIIDGGPGTGKSVVAINLLVALTTAGRVSKYVTKNAAPRKVFESVLTGGRTRSTIAALFGGSGEFTQAEESSFDALVVDEAHRLNEKSGLYGNLGEHQVQEIIDAAKCAIFFIDDDQRVTWKDIGTKAELADRARRAGATVTTLELASQFRCNGSDGYLAWLDDVLGIRETANDRFDPADYDFRVLDSPEALRRLIVEKNRKHNRARMVAGYCWDWKSKKDPAAMDVTLPEHGFAMQWNLARDGGLWIRARDSVQQIGCIHTCQGLEVDYIGVVVGPDLIVRDGKVVTRPERRSRHDQSIKGYKAEYRQNPVAAQARADAIIKNTYRTLMTRGMKGCYIYCVDPETAGYFRKRLALRAPEPERVSRMAAEDHGPYEPTDLCGG